TNFVYSADLIEHDLPGLALELALDARWMRSALGSHRRDDHSPDVAVHLIWRDHHTRPGLLNLAGDRGIEVHEVNVESTYYHAHSSSSQAVAPASWSSSSSSPAAAMVWNADAQPSRGCR